MPQDRMAGFTCFTVAMMRRPCSCAQPLAAVPDGREMEGVSSVAHGVFSEAPSGVGYRR